MTPALVLSKNIFYRNRESEHISNLEDCVRIIISWSEWGDSNSRHLEPKSSALPTGPHPDIETAVIIHHAAQKSNSFLSPVFAIASEKAGEVFDNLL